MSQPQNLIAIDIGNSRVKIARYDLPLPTDHQQSLAASATDAITSQQSLQPQIEQWLAEQPDDCECYISSVNRPSLEKVLAAFNNTQSAVQCTVLTHQSVGLKINLNRPERVGMDRLMAAVAANRLRVPEKPAVIVDLGTAIKVDWVSAAGEFLGGVIMPGIGMSARALHEQTDQLPLVEMASLDQPPEVLGTDTESAMRSGLFYGAVGAIRELISQLTTQLRQTPTTILTGGAGPSVCKLLGDEVLFSPNLVLDGIAVTAEAITTGQR